MSKVNKKDKQDGGDSMEVMKQIAACQDEIDKINVQCSKSILKLLQNYNKQITPFYKKRSETIQQSPNFWATSFNKHMKCFGIQGFEEKDLQRSLKEVEVKEFKKIELGFSISFHFDENPFFKNKVLKKEFHFKDDAVSISTPIKWKKGYGHKLFKKLSKKVTPSKTFFDWFSDNTNPDEDHIADIIKDDFWLNPLKHYFKTEEEKEEDNGEEDDEDDQHE